MPRTDVEFKTSDGVILRGWLYTPESVTSASCPLPCLVMCHGFSAVKEMYLDAFSERFTSQLALACLVYDNRGFGTSDVAPGQPRQDIIPAMQMSDLSDAITYAQSLPEVDADRIGIWGSSYGGGHVLHVGATDRRVKAVISQVPLVNGWDNFNRLVRPDISEVMTKSFEQDRLARAMGQACATLPVTAEKPEQPSAFPTVEIHTFFAEWEKKSRWKNEVTLRSLESLRAYDPSGWIHRISPTPLLMVVAERDTVTPTDLALAAYTKAHEPKELQVLPGGHLGVYTAPVFLKNTECQIDFLRRHLII
ncbi:DltD N-terminal domain protein [Thozetella sp. PMI_491]|nr:DltD N-terminal domain protein [Thozetella sp. PMI_491]